MTKYVVFLRGINVGGKNVILMKDLTPCFTSLGFTSVKTFIQSGNVLFESSLTEKKIVERIEEGLHKRFKAEIKTFVVPFSLLVNVIKKDPFKNIPDSVDTRKYVSFFRAENLVLPQFSLQKDVEVLSQKEGMVFFLSHRIKGKSGYPNAFLEKQGKIFATTRDLKTLQRIVCLP